MLMVVTPPDVSKCMVGPLSPYTIRSLQHIRDILNITFKLEKHVHEDVEDENLRLGADKVLLSCVGVGITNMYKKTS